MKLLKLFVKVALVIGIASIGCVYYAFKIEPYRLKVNEYTLLQAKTARVKIVQFSDTHVKADFTVADLEQVVTTINAQNPDIVVFTGDLYDNYHEYNDDEAIITALAKIEAQTAKLAIWGNRDYGGGASRVYEDIMAQAGFTILRNETLIVTTTQNKELMFTGLDESLLGVAELPNEPRQSVADYRILLTHEADPVDALETTQYNLVLSGHTHGGQVNIPILPFVNQAALSFTALASTYRAGFYELNQQTKLYVNTGIGTTHLSARFGVVPEIAVFNLEI